MDFVNTKGLRSDIFRSLVEDLVNENQQSFATMQFAKIEEKHRIYTMLQEELDQKAYAFIASIEEEDKKNQISIKDINEKLSEQDQDTVNGNILVLFMLCDMINGCVMDINDTINKAFPGSELKSFQTIEHLAMQSRGIISTILDKSSYTQDSYWGDVCDDLRKNLILNKARKINKKMQSKDWGTHERL